MNGRDDGDKLTDGADEAEGRDADVDVDAGDACIDSSSDEKLLEEEEVVDVRVGAGGSAKAPP